MGNQSPYSIPCRLVQGQTWAWTVTGLSSTYPLALWTLAYHLVSINPQKAITLNASNNGADFTVSVLPAATAVYTPSDRLRSESGYTWQAVVSRSDGGSPETILEKHVVARGTFDLEADLSAQAAGYDPRSAAQKQYDAIMAALATIGDDRIASYSMPDGRSVSYRDKPDLLKQLHNLERQIELEQRARELGCSVGSLKSSKYQVRFG